MERPPGVPASFDVRTVVYLRRGHNPPVLSDETMRGMSVYTVDASEARRLAEQDPAVRAGRFRVDVARWAVAAGRIAFPEVDGPVGRRVPFADL